MLPRFNRAGLRESRHVHAGVCELVILGGSEHSHVAVSLVHGAPPWPVGGPGPLAHLHQRGGVDDLGRAEALRAGDEPERPSDDPALGRGRHARSRGSSRRICDCKDMPALTVQIRAEVACRRDHAGNGAPNAVA